jgi:hypothetical protein
MNVPKIILAVLVALPLTGASPPAKDSAITGGPRAWALATTAFLTYYNREAIDRLAPDVRTDTSVVMTRRVLHDWWGIDSREDLFHALEFLERGGHRIEFQRLGQSLVSMNDATFKATLAVERSHPRRVRVLKLAREHYRACRGNSLVAWDYGRYIMLCRWGYMLGFLTEEEAWRRIMPAARTIQGSFRSWIRFGDDYLVGREFWSSEEMDRNGRIYRDIGKWLRNAPRSPWRRLPWRMDLGTP